MKGLLPLILAFAVSACSDDRKNSAWWANERRIIELNNRLELARFQLDQMNPEKGENESPRYDSESIDRLKQEIRALTLSKSELEASVVSMESEWNAFRRSILEERRSAVVANFFEELPVKEGRTFRNTTVTAIDDGGVSLRHASGTARLRCEDLDSDQQAYFGLDREFASAVHAQERETRVKYEARVNQQLAILEKTQRKASERQRKERVDTARILASASVRKSSSSGPLSSSVGELGETSFFSSRPSYRYYPYRSSWSRGRYYRVATPYCGSTVNPFNNGSGSGCNPYQRPVTVFPNR